jgi:hypothetical protein
MLKFIRILSFLVPYIPQGGTKKSTGLPFITGISFYSLHRYHNPYNTYCGRAKCYREITY